MSWRDWFGDPGATGDEVDKALVDAIGTLAKNVSSLAECVRTINTRLTALEENRNDGGPIERGFWNKRSTRQHEQ